MTALGPSENCHYIRLFLQPIILTVGSGLGACVRIILTTNAPASMFASHSSRLTRVGRRGRRRGRRKSQSRANCGWISIIVSYSGRLYWILSFGCQPRPVAGRRARRPLPSRATRTGRKAGRTMTVESPTNDRLFRISSKPWMNHAWHEFTGTRDPEEPEAPSSQLLHVFKKILIWMIDWPLRLKIVQIH